jgi:hypothetical protein
MMEKKGEISEGRAGGREGGKKWKKGGEGRRLKSIKRFKPFKGKSF